jgi:hypothetical protein
MPYQISHNKRDSIKSLVLKQEPTSIIAQRVGVSKWTVNRMKNEIDPEYVRPTGGGRRIVPLSYTRLYSQAIHTTCLN